MTIKITNIIILIIKNIFAFSLLGKTTAEDEDSNSESNDIDGFEIFWAA